MEYTEGQTNVANLEEQLVNLISNQTAFMGEVVQIVDYVRTYLRASRMMTRVCLAGADYDSNEERDLMALSTFLSELELFLAGAAGKMQTQYTGLAYVEAGLTQHIQEYQAARAGKAAAQPTVAKKRPTRTTKVK